MKNLMYRIRNSFSFSSEELKFLVVTILILGICVGFDDSSRTFVFGKWLVHFISMILLVAMGIVVHVSAQKIYGLWKGYNVEYKYWWPGIVIALAIAIVSMGKLWYFLPIGGIIVYHIGSHRLGHFRYGLNYKDLAMIAFAGSVANIVLALIFRIINYFPVNHAIVGQAVIINIAMAITTMLPIPPLNGLHIIYSSRSRYVFCIMAVIAASVLMYATNFILTIIGAVLIAVIVLVAYIWFVESELK